MNGFRVTILTLLCLAVALMFYTVLFVVPEWQEQYNFYQSSVQIEKYQNKSDIHRRQMTVFDPDYDTPEVERARRNAEEAERRSAQNVSEAEEANLLASARRDEEARREAQRRDEEMMRRSAKTGTLGNVIEFNEDYQFVVLRPTTTQPIMPGTELIVRRGNLVVCELVVERTEVEDGMIIANIKDVQLTVDGQNVLNTPPVVGDEVALNPFIGDHADATLPNRRYVPDDAAGSATDHSSSSLDALPDTMPTDGSGASPEQYSTPYPAAN